MYDLKETLENTTRTRKENDQLCVFSSLAGTIITKQLLLVMCFSRVLTSRGTEQNVSLFLLLIVPYLPSEVRTAFRFGEYDTMDST